LDISICILNRNQKALLESCLLSCIAELERSGLSGEVIVVDNGSDDGSPETVTQVFPDVHLIRNQENVSFSSANNQAIRASSGRYVFVLNNDTFLLPNCLGIMVRYLEDHRRVAAVGPKLLNPDGSIQQGYNRALPRLAEPLLWLLELNHFGAVRNLTTRFQSVDERLTAPTPIEQIAGCSLLLRRSALESVGLFDETFSYWFEDVELCHRIAKSGWGIYYLPEAQIIHHGGATFAGVGKPEKLTMYLTGLLRYFKRQRGLFQFGVLKLTAVLVLLFRLVSTAVLGLIPNARARRRWSGKPKVYWRALKSILQT
jgi:GT2 family glycosyltransferase